MEESNQFMHSACSSFTPASPESTSNGEYSGVSSTYSTNSQIVGEEANEVNTNRERNPDPEHLHQGTSVSYTAHSTVTEGDQAMVMGIIGRIRDESWSCVVTIFTFWFFGSITMIIGVYGSSRLLLGPNSSILIKPNPYFVEYVKIEELYEAGDGPMLYGFYKDPPLDAAITWSDTHNATLQSSTHKDWIYFLNEGSQINISYTVISTSSSSVVLVIAQGYEGLSQWLEYPSYQNTTLSWQVIQGNGMIQQDIFTSSSYYVAMRNLNDEAAVVQLNMRLRTLLYNTSGASNECSFARGECSVKLSFNGGNAALLTSPGPTPGRAMNEWYVKLSYGPRWIIYITGIGGTTVLVLAAIHFLSYCVRHDGSGTHFGETRSERTPLLPNKDDLSSWGSSYDSISQDDEEPEDPQAQGLLEGKPTKDGENNTRRLCAICFDAPRDCFFLPCGHCVTCFACGTRIAEAASTCPICRRHMKKVRKIFTV